MATIRRRFHLFGKTMKIKLAKIPPELYELIMKEAEAKAAEIIQREPGCLIKKEMSAAFLSVAPYKMVGAFWWL